ncbi:hypothetical protein KEM48_011223 [Puccinia striiformis f. sp. tritici PST-130]|uniref:Chitin-binding type-4 domain-containing protein n=1 Tax=Puccinia striiformis f. sp. tritici PST-78 TaxID=1165861 RepID=A0A0L0UTW1_9BASI|nr:hypothetical protein KEM48_011223 [Puccinia striiformis f. sp. tritici PST-130]KNE90189.1 hypothetical protein, variant [Puccinia striiformis f. sp. tritici PST-78]
MLSLTTLLAAVAIIGFAQLPYTFANSDPATGHLRNVRPTAAWLAKNKPGKVTADIQASECAMNTRLSFPKVQLFAWFKQNHAQDHYHGCPYGECSAYTVFPGPGDVEIDFTDAMSFFWHYTAGLKGTGVKVICKSFSLAIQSDNSNNPTPLQPSANPRTGALGYEQSLSGNFYDGAAPANSVQTLHDLNYPNFDPKAIIPWPKGAMDPFVWGQPEPMQPKCGRPCEQNKDPGLNPGVYGWGIYSPAPASKYPPPPNWKPDNEDQCPNGSTTPVPDQCSTFCSCASQCKDAKCASKCNPPKDCTKSKCPAAPAPAPGPAPQPGNDPDKCHNYCTCVDQCKHDKKCIKSSCHKIKHGCKTAKCSVNPPSTSDPNTPPSTPNPTQPDNPGQSSSSDPKKKKKTKNPKTGSGNQGSGNQGSGEQGSGGKGTGEKSSGKGGSSSMEGCQSYCSCLDGCQDGSCTSGCPNDSKCAGTCTLTKRTTK